MNDGTNLSDKLFKRPQGKHPTPHISWMIGLSVATIGGIASYAAATSNSIALSIGGIVATAAVGVAGIVLESRRAKSDGFPELPIGLISDLKPKVSNMLTFLVRVSESRTEVVASKAVQLVNEFLARIADFDKYSFHVKGTEAVEFLEEIINCADSPIFTCVTPGVAAEIDSTIGSCLRAPYILSDGKTKTRDVIKVIRLDHSDVASAEASAIAYADASSGIHVKKVSRSEAQRIDVVQKATNIIMVEGQRCGKALIQLISEGDGSVNASVHFDDLNLWNAYSRYRNQLQQKSTTWDVGIRDAVVASAEVTT